jgi:hypothetical protein
MQNKPNFQQASHFPRIVSPGAEDLHAKQSQFAGAQINANRCLQKEL